VRQSRQTLAIGLRRKKGVTISDLPKTKQKVLLELLALSAEELADSDRPYPSYPPTR